MQRSKDWYGFAIAEIRACRKRLSHIDKSFLNEAEYTILQGQVLDKELEEHLMELYNKSTEISRLARPSQV